MIKVGQDAGDFTVIGAVRPGRWLAQCRKCGGKKIILDDQSGWPCGCPEKKRGGWKMDPKAKEWVDLVDRGMNFARASRLCGTTVSKVRKAWSVLATEEQEAKRKRTVQKIMSMSLEIGVGYGLVFKAIEKLGLMEKESYSKEEEERIAELAVRILQEAFEKGIIGSARKAKEKTPKRPMRVPNAFPDTFGLKEISKAIKDVPPEGDTVTCSEFCQLSGVIKNSITSLGKRGHLPFITLEVDGRRIKLYYRSHAVAIGKARAAWRKELERRLGFGRFGR